MKPLKDILSNLQDPFFYHEERDFPSLDFNKEILKPGIRDDFPDGIIGLRVDDNFWQVAALPYECVEYSTEEIVQFLWPGLDASYNPDEDYVPSGYDESEEDE